MKIRVQPSEIVIPDSNPFQNDLLNREGFAGTLTRLVGSIDGPCVLALDAAWGAGKTTFIKMWAKHLRNEGFPVVEFNAWETDFASDPFLAISSELTEALSQLPAGSLPAYRIKRFATAAMKVGKQLAPIALEAVPYAGPALGGIARSAFGHLDADRLSAYQKERQSVSGFKEALNEIAKQLDSGNSNRPLVIIVDELDRCRPSYAIELLEVAKHLFMVDHIIFALAVNRSELAHSVKVLYGNGFDAEGYLRRFFDASLRLPAPNRNEFIDSLLITTQIRRNIVQRSPNDARGAIELLKNFFNAEHFTLRQIAQAIHYLGLAFALLPDNTTVSIMPITVALIIKAADSSIYYRFIQGNASDDEVADSVFDLLGMASIRETGQGAVFEAAIILASLRNGLVRLATIDTPLFNRYKECVANKTKNFTYAENVLHIIQHSYGGKEDFEWAVNVLDLLSA